MRGMNDGERPWRGTREENDSQFATNTMRQSKKNERTSMNNTTRKNMVAKVGKLWISKLCLYTGGPFFGSINSIIINQIYISLLHQRKFQIAFWPETHIVSYLVSYMCESASSTADTVGPGPNPADPLGWSFASFFMWKLTLCSWTNDKRTVLIKIPRLFVVSLSICLKIYLYLLRQQNILLIRISERSFLIPNPNISGRQKITIHLAAKTG